ncbi:hypothetical protein [Aquimarina rhabdastrellae]
MKNIVWTILLLTLISACKEETTTFKKRTTPDLSTVKLKDTVVRFLWREMKYDSALYGTYNEIVLNKSYIKTMTDVERAAIGYIATFVGNDCWWKNDEPNEEYTNLECKIITALALGCQCSAEHLGFLRKSFATDIEVLKTLENSNCPRIPNTATVQNTFDEIQLEITGNVITVNYKTKGTNFRAQESWNASEKKVFKVLDNERGLVLQNNSEN